MGEIYMYPVKRAIAYKDGVDSVVAEFHYDSRDEPISKRMSANPEDGIRFYKDLIEKSRAVLGPLKHQTGRLRPALFTS